MVGHSTPLKYIIKFPPLESEDIFKLIKIACWRFVVVFVLVVIGGGGVLVGWLVVGSWF